MGDCVEHGVNSLFLNEKLINVEGSAARVSKTEPSHSVFLEDLPQTRIVINSLRRNTEKFCLSRQFNFWVRHDPLFLAADLHKRELLNNVILCVVNADGGPRSIHSKCRTNQCPASLALNLFRVPDTEDGANGEVAVDDGAAVDWIKSDEILTVLRQFIHLWALFGGAAVDDA